MFHTEIDTSTEEVSCRGPHKVSSEGDVHGMAWHGMAWHGCSSHLTECRLSNALVHAVGIVAAFGGGNHPPPL